MVKNAVFDFGQVLIHYDKRYMTSRYVNDEEDIQYLSEVLFDRKYWDALDKGSITEEDVIASVLPEIPDRLRESAALILRNWYFNLPEIEGMRELIIYLREKYGLNIYVLSNISKVFAQISDKIPILSLVDGAVYSGAIGLVKPNAEIFAYLCEKFSLSPNDTVFVDDNEKNIAASQKFGIKSYLFDGNAEKLKTYFDELMKK